MIDLATNQNTANEKKAKQAERNPSIHASSSSVRSATVIVHIGAGLTNIEPDVVSDLYLVGCVARLPDDIE